MNMLTIGFLMISTTLYPCSVEVSSELIIIDTGKLNFWYLCIPRESTHVSSIPLVQSMYTFISF